MPSDLELLSERASRPVWVLCETQFRASSLEAKLPPSAHPGLWVSTVAEGVWRIFFQAFPGAARIPADAFDPLLLGLIRSGRFPTLAAELEALLAIGAGGQGAADSQAHLLRGARRFIDSVRLETSGEGVLGAMLDELGNTRADRVRLEELFLLLESFRTYQEDSKRFDLPGALELLVTKLRANDRALLALLSRNVPAIVLDQPSEIFPLEEELWTALGARGEVSLLLEEELVRAAESLAAARPFPSRREAPSHLPPSQRFLGGVLHFIAEKKPSVLAFSPPHEERETLTAELFDGLPVSNEKRRAPISVFVGEELRDEVRQVSRAIAYSLETGTVARDDLHLVALDLDAYEELLEHELSSLGVPSWVARGRRFNETPPGALLSAGIRWLSEPSQQSYEAFREHPGFSFPKLGAEVDAFFERYAGLLEGMKTRPSIDAIRERSTALLAGAASRRQLQRLFRVLVLPEKLQRAAAWSVPILEFLVKGGDTDPTTIEELICELVFIEAEMGLAQRLRECSASEIARLLRRRFHASRARLRKLSPTIPRAELGYAASALRAVRLLLRRAAESCPPDAHLEELVRFYERLARGEYCRTKRPPGAIPITELLDVRGLIGGIRIVLGASSRSFPGSAGDGVAVDETERVRDWVARRAGRVEPVYESYQLISHVLRASDEVHLSFSLQGEQVALQPASFVAQLRRSIEESETRLRRPDKGWSAAHTAETPHSARVARLLSARHGALISEFDGDISETTLEERLLALSERDADMGASGYSVSALEAFEDCPHRFYFSSLLRLREEADSSDAAIAIQGGIILHAALQRFFERYPSLPRTDFARACREMLVIAEEQFAKSAFPWSSHPAYRDQRRRIIEGLDTPLDEGRRGMLKAALVYQRTYLADEPIQLEYRFDGDRALEIRDEARVVRIRGAIDRVDGVREAGRTVVRAVWDYKTSPKSVVQSSVARRSIQVPIYALAAAQAFGGPVVSRGGVIALAEPNRNDEEMEHPTRGVLIDHLAPPKPKKSDTTPVRAPTETVRDRVLALDGLLREGHLHQFLETTGCELCDFRLICERDEALLEAKLASSTLSARSDRPERVTEEERAFVLREPTDEQRPALALDVPLVLSASAGSGKTFVLCNRVLTLLVAGNSFSSIVAITFTEKAAAEIRDRIERSIDAVLAAGRFLGKALEPEEEAHLRAARDHLASAQIGTIHSFASSILRMDPILSGLGAFRSILEGADRQTLLSSITTDLLSRTDSVDVRLLLDAGSRFRQIRGAVLNLAGRPATLHAMAESLLGEGKRAQLLADLEAEQRGFRDASLRKLSSWLSAWQKETREWLEAACAAGSLKSEEQEKAFRELLSCCDELCRSVDREDDCFVECFDKLVHFALENYDEHHVRKKGEQKNFWMAIRDSMKDWRKLRSALVSDRRADEMALELAAAVCRLALEVEAAFALEKRRQGAADFDDLIRAARNMLCSEQTGELEHRQARLRARLHDTFRHFLIDEFQDTDPVQWELLRELASPIGTGGRTLFLVGDRQQAIYSFRGGDVRVFHQATRELAELGGRSLRLEDNYRCHPEIVDFVNGLFSTLFAAPDEPIGPNTIRHEPMRPARTDEPEQRVFQLVPPEGDARSVIADEAEAVARFLDETLQTGGSCGASFPALAGHSGPVVAVLTRKVNQLLAVARALSARGIPYSMSHSNGFYELPEILQCQHLLDALISPESSIALVGLLRSPLFGLSDAELLRLGLALGQDWSTFPNAEVLPEWRPAQERFRQLQRNAAVLKGSQLLELATRELGLEAGYRAAGEADAFRNIERMIDALRAAEKSRGEGSLVFARNWLRQQRSLGSAAPNANSAQHPVVLATIHAAKGLEFPMVVLPFLSAHLQPGYDFVEGEVTFGESPLRTLLSVRVENEEDSFRRDSTFLQKIIQDANTEKSNAEEKRLFYVACTRAQEYLILSARPSKKEPSGSEPETGRRENPRRWLEAYGAALPQLRVSKL